MIFVFIASVYSIPLHKINYKDVFGNQCGLKPRRRIECLPLCVKNIDECPVELKPECPKGTKFCPDGKCLSTCKDSINICSCSDEKSDFVPCKIGKTINIKEYNSTIKHEQLRDQCNEELDIEDNVSLWSLGQSLPNNNYWAVCPTKKDKEFTYKEPMFISVFTIISFHVLILCLWTLYKAIREKGIKRMTVSEETLIVDKKEKEIELNQDKKFYLNCYKNDYFGYFTLYFLVLFSFGWLVYLSVITADYYGSLTGVEFSIANSSYNLSSQMFIGVWTSATVWFVLLNIFKERIRNFFRIKTNLEKSKYVQIDFEQQNQLFLDNNSRSIKLVKKVESHLKDFLGWNLIITTTELFKTKNKLIYFNYQCTRYIYNQEEDIFQPYNFNLGSTLKEIKQNNKGLTNEEAHDRLELKGPNFINVKVQNYVVALMHDFTSFFYLYQIMIMWLFYYFAYYQVGLVDTAVILISAIVKSVVRVNSEKRIKRMAEHESFVNVFRGNKWTKLSTRELVPGDIIQVDNDTTMPVDAIVLSGNIVADESSLTGEPLPIRKFPIREEEVKYVQSGSHKINSLFSGTKIIQSIKSDDDAYVTAIVYQTATSTDKGKLIRNILFPSPITFIFDEQLKIVILILALWAIVLFSLSMIFQKANPTASWFYGMFCLSQVLSPLLPAALVVGQSVSASRLRKKKIFCVDLPRIVIAGKIQIFAFDKTGTLTKEGLEFYGAQSIIDKEFQELKDFGNVDNELEIGIVTCHAVTEVDGTKIGNPVDIEMFNATKWEIFKSQNNQYVDSIKLGNKVLHIIKRYEFVHARASMSVAALDPETNNIHVFVKGSFEKLKNLVSEKSIPSNYDENTSKLAMEGCYVLAMAHKNLGEIDIEKIKLMEREEMEANIEMKGLIVFKNKLKDDTKQAITKIKNGSTRTIMITGDTVLTGIYIARACNMINQDSKVYLLNIIKEEFGWLDVDTYHGERRYLSHSELLKKLENSKEGIELAVSREGFQYLIENELIEQILLNIRIFARMGPQDKVDCIELHMKRGITAMCGDGGNDCGALRASHVGIALSESEASIVSPFSSSFRSIESCVELIKIGRSALATSFAGYKYLIMYGETMASIKIMSFYFSIAFSNAIAITVDAFITISLSYAVTQSKPAQTLASSRPTARLLGPETLLSVLGQIFINFMFLIGGYCILYNQEFYRCNEFDPTIVDISKWYLLGDNYEAQTFTFIALYQFINTGAVYNFGYKFRENWLKNWILVLIWSVLLIFVSCILLLNPNTIGCLLRLNCGDPDVLENLGYSIPRNTFSVYNIPSGHNVYPVYFRYALWAYCIANMVLGIFWEKFVVIGPVRNYFRKKYPLNRLRIKY